MFFITYIKEMRLFHPGSGFSCRWMEAQKAADGLCGASAHLSEQSSPFTPAFRLMFFKRLVCVPVWHLLMNGVRG